MRLIVMLVAALALAGCSVTDLVSNTQIATSPQADGMRTCAALTDILTPGVSPLAVARMAQGAISPTPGASLGGNPAEAMRMCAAINDALQ